MATTISTATKKPTASGRSASTGAVKKPITATVASTPTPAPEPTLAPADHAATYRQIHAQTRGAQEALAATRARLSDCARQLERIDRQARDDADDFGAEAATITRLRADLEQARVNASFRQGTEAEAIYQGRVDELGAQLAAAEQRLASAQQAAKERQQQRAAAREQLLAAEAQDRDAAAILEREIASLKAAAMDAHALLGEELAAALRADYNAILDKEAHVKELTREIEHAKAALPGRARDDLRQWPDQLKGLEWDLRKWEAPGRPTPIEQALDVYTQWLSLLTVERYTTPWWTDQPHEVLDPKSHNYLPGILAISVGEMDAILRDPRDRGLAILRNKLGALRMYRERYVPDTAKQQQESKGWLFDAADDVDEW